MLNKNYGNLTTAGSIQYAPREFRENGQLFVPRIDNDDAYLSRGWYKIINIKPSYDAASQVAYIQNWIKDDEAKTITANYVVQARPEDTLEKTRKFSKLRITLFCIEQGIWEDIKEFLISLGYYDLFVMAQFFLETDEYFKKGLELFTEMYKEKDPTVDIDSMVDTMLNFAFDGYVILDEDEKIIGY